MIHKFTDHLIDFIRKNTWVLVIYSLIMLSLFMMPGDKDKNQTIFNAFITSSLHFIGDIFIMMMIDDYQAENRKSGSRLQLAAMVVFTTAKIYCALQEHTWQYLLTDAAFIISAAKNYQVDVAGKKFFIDKPWKFICVCAVCFLGYLVFLLNENNMGNVVSRSDGYLSDLLGIVQVVGLLTFAYSLFISDSKSVSNVLSIAGLSVVVTVSGIMVLKMLFRIDKPVGLNISFFLLPLVVLIHKLRASVGGNFNHHSFS